ncbi:MAG: hypothetical protein ACOCP4_01965 [Candidatus Woesearchaeota archaeon]
MQPKIGKVCRSFNMLGAVCTGSSEIDKEIWCYQCDCYIPPHSCRKCYNGIIYKKIKYINKHFKSEEYLVEDFCNCEKGSMLLRETYEPKVYKKI